MKCLAISNSYPPDHAGGYELGAKNLLDALAVGAGWQNTVVSSVRKQSPSGVDSLQLTGFFPGTLGPEIERFKVRRTLIKKHDGIVKELQLKAKGADVILVFNPRRLILPQWYSVLDCGKPVFVFVSDYWPKDPLQSDIFYAKCPKLKNGSLKDSRLQTLYQSIQNRGDLMSGFHGALFGSRFLQKANSVSLSRVKQQCVTHWGIDMDQFPPVDFSPERLQTFGFCGRPDKEKGLDLALTAFQSLVKEDSDLRLLVASDLSGSAFGRSVRKRVRNNSILKNSVVLMGHLPHSELHARFYSQIGGLIFPSIWEEPFALTVLEAMASGALVIASATGGTPEVVDAENGYLFDPGREDDLLTVWTQAIENGKSNKQRVECGIRRIREFHTMPGMAREVDAFIRNSI